jgi:cyclic 2,3-diphosphoglycerate synthetase
MKVVVLVDGEHYPSVTRWAIDELRAGGLEPLAALFVGGGEKLDPSSALDLGVPLRGSGSSEAPIAPAVGDAIDELHPEAIFDLSDEPVLGYRERMEIAAVALARGVPYLGPDFRFDPPIEEPPLPVPTIAVIGTGKRTGKTAVSGEAARVAAALGLEPIVVAMGRGGPAEPEVARAGTVTLDVLLGLVRAGRHAASDYLEIAATSGVTTVGARRAGGGVAGRPAFTNVRAAAEWRSGWEPGLDRRRSGASVPTFPWDAGVLVVPSTVPPEYLGGYLGPFRLLLSDLVVVTMASSPAGLQNIPTLRSHVERLNADARLIVTDFEPQPLGDVRGRDVFFTTTAPGAVAAKQAETLERTHGCRVVGWSAKLADRAGLAQDLDGAEAYEVLLSELKAAAIDVACDRAMSRGAEVVLVDNRAVVSEGDMDLPTALRETIGLAGERSRQR